MKQIIKNPVPVDVVAVSDCDTTKYYGFSATPHEHDNKGFITQKGYMSQDFMPLSVSNVTAGYSYISGKATSLKAALDYLLNLGAGNDEIDEVFKVYQFDTSKELFTWLAAD